MKTQFLLSLHCSASLLHAAGPTKSALAEALAREDIAAIRAAVLSGNAAAARAKLDGDGRSLVVAKDAAEFLMWAQEQAGTGLYPFPAARGTSSERAMEVATAFLAKAERAVRFAGTMPGKKAS